MDGEKKLSFLVLLSSASLWDYHDEDYSVKTTTQSVAHDRHYDEVYDEGDSDSSEEEETSSIIPSTTEIISTTVLRTESTSKTVLRTESTSKIDSIVFEYLTTKFDPELFSIYLKKASK